MALVVHVFVEVVANALVLLVALFLLKALLRRPVEPVLGRESDVSVTHHNDRDELS